MTAGSAPLAADPAVVRSFIEAFHSMAATALNGARNPGMLQLVRIHPADEKPMAEQFPLGDVDAMAQRAVMHAAAGFNVYVEPRTVGRIEKGERGKLSDTRGVFAFVIDADNDKGKGGSSTAEPTLAVETSPGNAHHWLGLSRALTADEAKPIGEAIRAGSGADSATGVLTQPYRVAGTPNYPGKLKLARGRVAVETRLLATAGKVWTADELRIAFPAQEKVERVIDRPEGRSSAKSGLVEALAAETGDDRSGRFYAAVAAARVAGMTPDDLEDVLRRFPEGCGGKYLEPYDRLEREIWRAWQKVEAKAEEIREAASKPAYADASQSVEAARDAVAAAVARFLAEASEYRLTADEEALPPVHGLAVSTGVGKTQTTALAIAEHIKARRGTIRTPKPILYAVPTHRLGNEIERQFREHGVEARVFRGRQAGNPERDGAPMCDDLEAVNIALQLGERVQESCCKKKLTNGIVVKCPHFHTCAYQEQTRTSPDVWIVAHQLVFQGNNNLGKVEALIIDESFWQAGIRPPSRGVTLDEIRASIPVGTARDDALHNDVETYRARLARGLKDQDQDAAEGGVRREHLLRAGLTTDLCTAAISAEWRLKGGAALWPGMPQDERRKAAEAASRAKHAKGFIGLWHAARDLIASPEIEVSGHLYLEHREDDDGRVLVVKARSRREIPAGLQDVPTLILDATLPAPEILRAFFPQIDTPPAIEAAMPNVRVRQVIDAPVSMNKLRPKDETCAGRNLTAVRRAILRRFIEIGRKPMLVIAQKAVADRLRSSGLPAGVAVEWFNNVAGLDQYRAVRALMVIGRTVPGPAAVEALAGALTGREANLIPKGNWYAPTVRGIRTRDGSAAGVECDAHPDPIAEACRWQVCEGELMQAIGRGRGVNRTADNPLDIDIVCNVVLPVTVDAVEAWEQPGEEIEMQAEGVVLESAADMATAWPGLWPTAGAARVWLHRHSPASAVHTVTEPYIDTLIGKCNGVKFRYQRAGARQKWKVGAYDPSVVPDIKAWLTSRLGPLASLQVEDAAPPAPRQRLRAADYDPALVARFACVAQGEPVPSRAAPALPDASLFDPDAPVSFPPFARAILNPPPRGPRETGRVSGLGSRSCAHIIQPEHAV